MAKYRVLSGIDYPPNKRAEAGDVVDDLPPTSVKWLLESNVIEPADKAAQVIADEPAVEEVAPVEEVIEEVTPTEETPAEEVSSDEQPIEAGE